MGCTSSAPVFEPLAFLEPHDVETNNLLPPEGTRLTLAFAARKTKLLKDGAPNEISLTVYAERERMAMGLAIQNPDGDAQLGVATLPAWSHPQPFLHLRGTAKKAAKELELRLEVCQWVGATQLPIGLALAKARQASDAELTAGASPVHIELHIYSTKPRLTSQIAAKEPTYNLAKNAFMPTGKPMVTSDGQSLYAWARVAQPRSLVDGPPSTSWKIFMADGSSQSKPRYVARPPRGVGRTGTSMLTMTKGGCGCLVMQPQRLPAEALGYTHAKGQTVEALTLSIAPGIDAALMVAFAVLWEKAVEHEKNLVDWRLHGF